MANEYLSESPVELALRFADLAGSSSMTKVLAEEVRRIRGIVLKDAENQEAIVEGMRAGQCACTWYDTGGVHATNCTKVALTQGQAAQAELNRTREELAGVRNEMRRIRNEYGGLSVRLTASRTEREKLHGDKVRMLAAIDGVLASLRPYMDTRGAPFPLPNALVLKPHEFTESSDVPGSCALCGWTERSQVHGASQSKDLEAELQAADPVFIAKRFAAVQEQVQNQATPHKYVSVTEEYPGSGPGECVTCGSGEWDSIHDQHRVVPPVAVPAEDVPLEANAQRVLAIADCKGEVYETVALPRAMPAIQDLEEHDESIQAELDNCEDEDDRRPL